MNAIHNTIARETSRKAVDSWTRTDGYRVKIDTFHDKQRKVYRSTISECVAEEREGYTMERFTVFVDLCKILISQPVARYNFAKLQELHAEVVAAMEEEVASLINNHAPIEREVA